MRMVITRYPDKLTRERGRRRMLQGQAIHQLTELVQQSHQHHKYTGKHLPAAIVLDTWLQMLQNDTEPDWWRNFMEWTLLERICPARATAAFFLRKLAAKAVTQSPPQEATPCPPNDDT